MKGRKVNKIYLLSSVFFMLLSFACCLNLFKPTYSAKQTNLIKNAIYLKNVSDVVYSDNTLNNNIPVIKEKEIDFSVVFNGKNDYYQFFFDVVNEGNNKQEIKDIKIKGISNKDKVTISIIGIKKGDIIESGRYVDNVKVIVNCVGDLYNEGVKKAIVEKIKIVIDFEAKE